MSGRLVLVAGVGLSLAFALRERRLAARLALARRERDWFIACAERARKTNGRALV